MRFIIIERHGVIGYVAVMYVRSLMDVCPSGHDFISIQKIQDVRIHTTGFRCVCFLFMQRLVLKEGMGMQSIVL